VDTIVELLSRGIGQLIGRAEGPLHFRLVVMPTVVTILGIRAGLRDAREGHTKFLWALLTHTSERRSIVRSVVKDIGRVFLMALVLDSTYQLIVLRWIYPGQLLIVAVACAIVPYIVVRGPVSLLARALRKPQPASRRN
jgi:hypothetical protein